MPTFTFGETTGVFLTFTHLFLGTFILVWGISFGTHDPELDPPLTS